MGTGYQKAFSHSLQRLIRKRPSAAASQKGLVSTLTAGGGIGRVIGADGSRVSDMFSPPFP